MKKSMTGVVALLAGAFVVHGQGTVMFANYLSLSPYIYVSYSVGTPYVGTTLGGSSTVTTGYPWQDVHNGNDWTVALYGNSGWYDSASNLVQLETEGGQPVMTTLEIGNGDDAQPGTWYSYAVGDVPGTTGKGSLATVQIRAWYNDGGNYTNYEAALSAGIPVGVSAAVNIITGGPNPVGPPETAASLPSGTGQCQLGNVVITVPPLTIVGPYPPLPDPSLDCVQPPAELAMTINHAKSGTLAPDSITLTWPATDGGFFVQSATNLFAPTVWVTVTNASVAVDARAGGQYSVTMTNMIAATQQFFRLADP